MRPSRGEYCHTARATALHQRSHPGPNGIVFHLPVPTHQRQPTPRIGPPSCQARHARADLAVQAGSRLYTDSASSYRALKGYVHEFVNHTKMEYTRGDVHENRAECLFSLLKPYLRVFRGVSKGNLSGYVGFFQFLRNFRQQNAYEQAELILRAALDPTIAIRAKRGA
jgi:transposase-like protein